MTFKFLSHQRSIASFLCMMGTLPFLVSADTGIETTEAQTAKQQLQDKLADLQTLQGNFSQRVYDGHELLQEGSGRFVLERPARLRWETDAPDESLLIADGQTLWYYNPFIEQVSLFNQTDAMQANPLLLLLDAQSDNWSTFHVSYADARWTVRETESAGIAATLHLEFAQDDAQTLSRLILDDGQGQRSEFALADVYKNQAVAPQSFHFDVPEGVDIDDQRD